MSTKRANARKVSVNHTNVTHMVRPFSLKDFAPLTITQKNVYKAFRNRKNLFLTGSAGTGKTFVSLYLALSEVRDSDEFKSVTIVRSAVEVRSIGALPGSAEEKLEPFEAPYCGICEQLYDDSKAYSKLKDAGTIKFLPTSFIRGTTLNDTIVIVDEASNLSFHELDSIITRLGNNSRIIFCGDIRQSDLTKESERKGYLEFESIIERMKSFDIIDFMPADIVRSGLVKEYLLASER